MGGGVGACQLVSLVVFSTLPRSAVHPPCVCAAVTALLDRALASSGAHKRAP